MTVKSRLLATALAISLATPAAAVTITLSTSTSYLPRTAFQILGPETFTDGFFVGLAGSVLIPAPPVLEPAGGDMTKYGDWDYAVDYFAFYPNQVPWIGPGGVVASGCYSNHMQCFKEIRSGSAYVHVGDALLFSVMWLASGVYQGLHPDIQLTFALPEGVTLAQTPLPASWLLFASALGLAGWFSRWRRAHA